MPGSVRFFRLIFSGKYRARIGRVRVVCSPYCKYG
jgi:hypothetical protein